MTEAAEVVLSAIADGREHTTVDLANETGLDIELIRAALYQLRLPGWAHRGEVGDHGARSWRITNKGKAALEARSKRRAKQRKAANR